MIGRLGLLEAPTCEVARVGAMGPRTVGRPPAVRRHIWPVVVIGRRQLVEARNPVVARTVAVVMTGRRATLRRITDPQQVVSLLHATASALGAMTGRRDPVEAPNPMVV